MMKSKIGAVTVLLALLLSACGGGGDEDSNGGDGGDERNRASAIATLVAFVHEIDAEDYRAACERVLPLMRAPTCEESLQGLRGETDPGRFGEMSEADVVVSSFAESGCAYYVAQGGRDGENLPTGSAILVWHEGSWYVESIGNLDRDDYAADRLSEADVKAYPCD